MKNDATMITDKLPNHGESIFATMTGLAVKHNALNVSQGFPDFECPAELKDLVHHYIQKGMNQYAPMPGTPVLREAIMRKTERMYGSHYDHNTEITVTAGATQALYTVITAVTSPGDECIIFEPAYDSYLPAIILSGGIPVPVSLDLDASGFPWDEIEAKVNHKTRFVLINSPHNPAGFVMSESDREHFAVLSQKFPSLLFICDDVYENIIFSGKEHYSFSNHNGLKPKSIIISSFGKSYHTTGWKIGYILAPFHLTNLIRKIHQFVVFSVNTPIQCAYADFLSNDEHTRSLSPFYESKRDLFNHKLVGSKFSFVPAEGTYFQLLDYTGISKMNDVEFAEKLVREHGIAVIPLSPFYINRKQTGKIRVCFAKNDDVLINAAEKLLAV